MKLASFDKMDTAKPETSQLENQGKRVEQQSENQKLSPAETVDDNGRKYRTEDGGWLPNNEYTLDGIEYKTDDNGSVYKCDGTYYPDDWFVLNGNLYVTDSNGEVIGGDVEEGNSEYGNTAVEQNDKQDLSQQLQGTLSPRRGFLPGNHGEWSGDAGNSIWQPDPEYTPLEKSKNSEKPYSNPDNLTWAELMEKYGIEGIEFRDGYPVFDDVARGTVEIDDFTDDRSSNFDQANEKMAEQKGCSPEEVENWMKENNYTWHECQDCKTMQKVPNEIHANVPHEGGVSVYKSEHTN